MGCKRGFEIVTNYASEGIHLPKRATRYAAGYDFEAAENIEIPSIWQAKAEAKAKADGEGLKLITVEKQNFASVKPVLIPTGIKAYMGEDEYLELVNRSSNPLKRFLLMANGVGVVDSDYYNNPDNEGHIFFQFLNFGFSSVRIQKGERIGQGIFHSCLKSDNDVEGKERLSGFGSTGK